MMLSWERSIDRGLLVEALGGGEEGKVEGLKVYRTGDVPEQMGSAGPMRAVLSTAEPDRHGDVVEQEWLLDNYRLNPVMLWAHQHREPTVGRVMDVGVVGGNLVGNLEFAPTEKGKELEALYRGGYLKGLSVGFIPHRIAIRRNQDGDFLGFRFFQNELLEVSTVNVPANPYAMIEEGGDTGLERGLKPGVLLEAAGISDIEEFKPPPRRRSRRGEM